MIYRGRHIVLQSLTQAARNPRETEGPDKPEAIPAGTKLACINVESRGTFKGPKTITECSVYTVVSHDSYYNCYEGGVHKWDQFVIIDNDYGKPIKVNLNRFKILKNKK
jgi:hypothetical protein